MKSLTVPAQKDRLNEVTQFVDAELEAWDCPMKIQSQIDLAVEEIFINIASYAYGGGAGEAEVRCEILREPLRAELRFLDRGVPFDPLDREDADTSPEALESRVGGLGILLVKRMMDEVRYVRENGQNILTIGKNLREES